MSATGTEKRVLCVEDDLDTCQLVSAILPEFHIISTETAEKAWQLYNEQKFSLVIVDYHISGGSGLELCERIRSRDYLTPVIVISGDHQLTEAEARIAGAQRLIMKGSVTFVDDLVSAANTLHVY